MAQLGPSIRNREQIYELVEMWDEYQFWYRVIHFGDAPPEPQLDEELIWDLPWSPP